MDLTNHWGTLRNSIGVWHLQQVPMFWSRGSCFTSRPWAFMSSMMAFLASATAMPAYLPASSVIRPSSSMPFSRGSSYLMIRSRSSLSPMEQTMSVPVPNAVSTLASAMTLTFLPNTGVTSSLPTRWPLALSSGFTATRRHVQSSWGLVVAMRTSLPVSASLNLM